MTFSDVWIVAVVVPGSSPGVRTAFTDADAPDHFDFEGLATEIIQREKKLLAG